MSREMVMILAGGKGQRLSPLTKARAKSALPFGGRYRIIDFVLSNFANSGFFKINVITQFMSESLNKHISKGWRFSSQMDHYVDVVPPQMKRGEMWYKGTSDAVYQNLNLIEDEDPEYVFVFGGDHVYKMDMRQMLEYHKARSADLTIATLPGPRSEAKAFGIVEVDRDLRITGFSEKPDNPKSLPQDSEKVLISMGNYIFNRNVLVEELRKSVEECEGEDFGRDLLPGLLQQRKVYAYDFATNTIPGIEEKERGYWRDIGTIDAYWEANMDLVAPLPQFNLYCQKWPLRTTNPDYPPAKFVFANWEEQRVGYATDSLVSEGCIISGGKVSRSVLSCGVRVNSYAQVTESILMEGVDIGRNCRIQKAIIDRGVRIPPDTDIGYDQEADRKRFYMSQKGVVVVSTVVHKDVRVAAGV